MESNAQTKHDFNLKIVSNKPGYSTTDFDDLYPVQSSDHSKLEHNHTANENLNQYQYKPLSRPDWFEQVEEFDSSPFRNATNKNWLENFNDETIFPVCLTDFPLIQCKVYNLFEIMNCIFNNIYVFYYGRHRKVGLMFMTL